MKTAKIMLPTLMSVAMLLCGSVRAQDVTEEEAVIVAANWIRAIIASEGNWGGHDAAQLADIQAFTRDDEFIGYCFAVEPVGYILVSLRHELAPVQAYSATCNLDPTSDEGLVEVLKLKMAGLLHTFDQVSSKPGLTIASVPDQVLEVDYAPVWAALSVISLSGQLGIQSEISIAAEGDTVGPLLTSSWNQTWPYNYFCPTNSTCGHCPVGCGPLAMAQIMRYWAWPPISPRAQSFTENGVFRWWDMPDSLPQSWPSSDTRTESQVRAVAALCSDTGVLCHADYCDGGCRTSTILDEGWFLGGFVREMTDVLLWLSYNDDIEVKDRDDDTAARWFERIQNQVNQNRPVLYAIPDHYIVADGWREVSINGAVVKQYHMNYGWGGSAGDTDSCPTWAQYTNSNSWYTLDALPCRDLAAERLVIGLSPNCAVGTVLMGKHVGVPVLYVYFDQDAAPLAGWPLDVEYIGYSCQFLPGVTLRTSAPPTPASIQGAVTFEGALTGMRLFSIKGTSTASVKISPNGVMALRDGGCLRFF